MLHTDQDDVLSQAFASWLSEGGPTFCGMDGGMKQDKGTFGFSWASARDTKHLFGEGKGRVPGTYLIMSSTRAELGGVFGALTYLRLSIEHFRVKLHLSFAVTLFCDSRAALSRMRKVDADLALSQFSTTWRCRAHYDYEAALKAAINALPFPVHWRWIKGHAAQRKKPDELSWPEHLNKFADDLATAAYNIPATDIDSDHWPEQVISVIGPRGRMCGRLQEELRCCCTAPSLLAYWTNRFAWTDDTHSLLDHSGADRAISRLDPADLQRVQKLRCGWLPVNRRLSREDPDRPAGCSACQPVDSVEETVDHVLQCPSTRRRTLVTERISSLTKTFREWKTDLMICEIFTAAALHWVQTPQEDFVFQVPADIPSRDILLSAINSQNEIGWGLLFRGFVSLEWRLLQEAFYSRRTGSRGKMDNGEHWARKVVTWFFEFFRLAWFLRNEDEHGADEFTQQVILSRRLERTVRQPYSIGDAFPDRERQLICKDSIDTILTAKLHLQELWIERAEAFILRARKRIKNQQDSSQRAITEFFLPSNRPPPGPAQDNLAKSTWLPPFFLPHALHLTSPPQNPTMADCNNSEQ